MPVATKPYVESRTSSDCRALTTNCGADDCATVLSAGCQDVRNGCTALHSHRQQYSLYRDNVESASVVCRLQPLHEDFPFLLHQVYTRCFRRCRTSASGRFRYDGWGAMAMPYPVPLSEAWGPPSLAHYM